MVQDEWLPARTPGLEFYRHSGETAHTALSVQSLSIRDGFARFHVLLEQSEVHSPAETRNAIVLSIRLPARVQECDPGHLLLFKLYSEACSGPVRHGRSKNPLARSIGFNMGNLCSPVILFRKEKSIFTLTIRFTLAFKGPPGIQACRC